MVATHHGIHLVVHVVGIGCQQDDRGAHGMERTGRPPDGTVREASDRGR
jgi:hypothetical protein